MHAMLLRLPCHAVSTQPHRGREKPQGLAEGVNTRRMVGKLFHAFSYRLV